MAVADNKVVLDPMPSHEALDMNALVIIRPAIYVHKDGVETLAGMGLPREYTVAQFAEMLASGGSSVTSDQITDATVIGKTILKAADAAAVRNSISVPIIATTAPANAGAAAAAVGTSATAARSDHVHVVAPATAAITGGIKKGSAVADCVPAADGTSAGTQLNALLASLRTAGVIS